MRTIFHYLETTGPGGAETVCIEVAHALDRSRYRSVVGVLGSGWVADRLGELGVEVIRLDDYASDRVGLIAALARTGRTIKASVIHGHLVGGGLYAAIAGRLIGARVVVTIHGHADLPTNDRFRWLRFALLGRAAHRVAFVSESLRDHFLAQTPLNSSRTVVIPNGLSLKRFYPGRSFNLRERFGIGPEHLLVGSLGNIREPKGYDVLLRAVARLPERLPWRVLIAGDTSGAVYPRLLALVAELGLAERVSFAGFQPDPAETLRNFDLFVLPSTSEGFSLATVQALATGLPVIATRSGGPEEILGTETGQLVPPGDELALAKAIELAISDPSRRIMLAVRSRAASAPYSLSRMVEAYEALYDG